MSLLTIGSRFVADPGQLGFRNSQVGLHKLEVLNFGVKCQFHGGEYEAGGSERVYLPSTSANGERKRARCGREFRIKGGRAL